MSLESSPTAVENMPILNRIRVKNRLEGHQTPKRWPRGFSLSAPHLQQTVPNESHQQLVAEPLPDQGGVLRGVHAGEVKHGHVRLPAVVGGVVQRGELVVGAKVSSLAGVAQESFLVDVLAAQQHLGVGVVLSRSRTVDGELTQNAGALDLVPVCSV